MTSSVFNASVVSALLGDEEVATFFSAAAELEALSRFEAALARAEAATGLIPVHAAEAICAALAVFVPDLPRLRVATARDGVMVPEWVRQVRATLSKDVREHVHFGATSQDAIDTSLVLRLKAIAVLFEVRLGEIIAKLEDLDRRFGRRRIMARTRMQDALEIDIASRLADWRLPLVRHRARLSEMLPRVIVLQLGGAVGDRSKLGERGDDIARLVANELDIGMAQKAWHSQRDGLLEMAAWLAQISGTLGKIGQDVALMALAGAEQIELTDSGGSSAMPHKHNPIVAEALVGLARYNAALLGAIGQAAVHEQERSGAAWLLEWLTLPQMLITTGSSLKLAQRLLGAISSLGR